MCWGGSCEAFDFLVAWSADANIFWGQLCEGLVVGMEVVRGCEVMVGGERKASIVWYAAMSVLPVGGRHRQRVSRRLIER